MSSVEVGSALTSSWPDDAVEVGRVLGAWGVKGWIKVQSFASNSTLLLSSDRWLMKPAESGRPARLPLSGCLAVIEVREHGGVLVAQVEGVTDRTQAEALRGVRIFMSRGHFPKTKAGEYYLVDLMGIPVFNREGVPMGAVVGLIDTGPHSVLRLSLAEGQPSSEEHERLIPFVAAYVDDVDLVARRITVDWGLDY